MKANSLFWHPLTEPFDRKRPVVFTDGKLISGSIRFMIGVEDMWLADQKKKAGISYSHWAYTDDLISL